MKFLQWIIQVAVIALMVAGCTTTHSTDEGPPLTGVTHAVLNVRGMSCPLCSNNLDGRLTRSPGIDEVRINLENGEVTAIFNPDHPPTRAEIERAVRDSGFTLGGMELHP